MSPKCMLVQILIVTCCFLPCFPGVVRVPGENDESRDVLFDSTEELGVNELPELLNKLTEGGSYGTVERVKIWLENFNKEYLNVSAALSEASWAYQTNVTDGLAAQASRWIHKFNKELAILRNKEALGAWVYETNMTDANAAKMEAVEKLFIQWSEKQQPEARRFYYHFKRCKSGLAPCTPHTIAYSLKKIVNGLSIPSPKDAKKRNDMLHLNSELSAIYAKGTLEKDGKTYQIEPELTKLMANSRDYDELLWAWQGWRNVTGRKMRDKYLKYVALQNEGAQEIGLSDIGAHNRISNYDMDKELEVMVDSLFRQVMPIYSQLHAYVRRKLIKKYPNHGLDPAGPIPAHLLGNMWAQQWDNIYDLLVPYPEIDSIDVSSAMRDQGYDPIRMFRTAESFYTSIGLDPMTPTFWEKSMITKPTDGRQVVCHAAADDMGIGDDYRIKMCTVVNQDYLKTIHHEMGHIEYYMQYRPQPPIFRGGANAAFHEAIGDTIALSVMTPAHLHAIGLLNDSDDQSIEHKRKRDINALMTMALFKIAFLPFGYLIDKYRWEIYRGTITKDDLNGKWWEYRIKYQGIKPPVERTEEDFDAGAKYHVAADVPYMRYFLSFIGQFQFHKALCHTAGQYGELHNCDIYQSLEAGKRLKKALSLGCSEPWEDVMEVLTGQRSFDIAPMEEYFRPLLDWLKEQNKDEHIGWTGQYSGDSISEKSRDLQEELEVRELLMQILEAEDDN